MEKLLSAEHVEHKYAVRMGIVMLREEGEGTNEIAVLKNLLTLNILRDSLVLIAIWQVNRELLLVYANVREVSCKKELKKSNLEVDFLLGVSRRIRY
jgi:hypothetical protein